MAWVKLDDHFFRHPKVIAAGRDARDLYLAGLCYCGSGLTDGLIPAGALRMLAADADIDDPRIAAASLVRVGLWESRAGGDFLVHDYHEYQPSKERVLATREVRAEAGSKGGKQKASNLLEASQTFAEKNFKQNSTPSRPTPVPVKSQSNDPSVDGAHAPNAREKYPPKFETFWSAYPRGHGDKKPTYAAWKLIPESEQDDVLAGLAAWKTSDRWKRGYILAADQFLKRGRWKEPIPEGEARASPSNGRMGIDERWASAATELQNGTQPTDTAIETTWRPR